MFDITVRVPKDCGNNFHGKLNPCFQDLIGHQYSGFWGGREKFIRGLGPRNWGRDFNSLILKKGLVEEKT